MYGTCDLIQMPYRIHINGDCDLIFTTSIFLGATVHSAQEGRQGILEHAVRKVCTMTKGIGRRLGAALAVAVIKDTAYRKQEKKMALQKEQKRKKEEEKIEKRKKAKDLAAKNPEAQVGRKGKNRKGKNKGGE